jgi:hypothetical protein
MEKKLIPLYTIPVGRFFRIPGLNKKFKKQDNEQAILFQDHLPDGTIVAGKTHACLCSSPGGKTFVKPWWDWVQEVEEEN